MDNTKLYIKMSEKAKDIQKIVKDVTGDFYCDNLYAINIDKAKQWQVSCSAFENNKGSLQFVQYSEIKDIGIWYHLGNYPKYVIPKEEWDIFIWLPHQYQLQKIYLNYKAEEIERECKYKEQKEFCYKKQLDWMCSSFSSFQRVDILQFDDLYPLQFTSMEQLWLAFVMKEKYNKTWNGEDWVEK